ncbi:MAG: hypothetical protein GY777_31015 [Candidatus Brocadiaceae bacterium]|nr:hypothetical protein [Candidatus Brocadiaceae bacterium]
MNKKSIPRRKRLKRVNRLNSAKHWIRNYSGKHIVRGYAKWYGVGLICAIVELRVNGIIISEDYENQVRQSIENKIQASKKQKEMRADKLQESLTEYSDSRFAFIVGHTSGGAAYGVTHEEMEIYNDDYIDGFNELKH